MIIIFFGAHATLPLAAAYLHLENNGSDGMVPSAWWDRKINPLAVMGTDRQGNIICCLSSGRRTDVYQRAITGIAGIFNSDIKLVNVDEVAASLSINYLDKTKWLGAKIAPHLYGPWLINFLRPLSGQILR